MLILAFSDLHGTTAPLATIFSATGPVDLVLLAGDITNFGGAPEAARVIGAIEKHCRHILAVPGNCDLPAVADYLDEKDMLLHSRSIEKNGVCFAGAGYSLPCPGQTPGEISDRQLGDLLAASLTVRPTGIPLILLTHEPPYNTCTDLAHTGKHVGSRALRRFIEETRPLACFTGHIHEGRGTDLIGLTEIINPGPLRRGGYALARLGNNRIRLELHNAYPHNSSK